MEEHVENQNILYSPEVLQSVLKVMRLKVQIYSS